MSVTTTMPVYKESLQELVQQLSTMLPGDKLAIFNTDAQNLAAKYTTPLKLCAGDQAPLFSLPNATGNLISLNDLLRHGPVILTFYRGVWCPYCNLELRTYQQILPQIKQAGANLVAVSPMTPDNSLQLKDTNALEFEVLSDVGNKVARQFTTVFKNPDTSINAMAELGYDFNGFYGDTSAEIPVPATFVISKNGIIKFAGTAGGDYRERVEPSKILELLTQ